MCDKNITLKLTGHTGGMSGIQGAFKLFTNFQRQAWVYREYHYPPVINEKNVLDGLLMDINGHSFFFQLLTSNHVQKWEWMTSILQKHCCTMASKSKVFFFPALDQPSSFSHRGI